MSVWTRLRAEERGVSAVLVSICLVAIFGAAMLSVDAGQLWGARRNIVTGTDASALAQARYFALNATTQPTTCTSVYSDTLNANANETFDVQCSVVNASSDGSSGVVIVQARKTSKARFSGVLGIGDSAAFSMSAAQWGFVSQPLGLRPIGLCVSDPHVADALLNGTPVETHSPLNPLTPEDYFAPDGSVDYAHDQTLFPDNFNSTIPAQRGVVHHVEFQSSCEGAPGNFGWIDLNENGGDHDPELDCTGSCTSNNDGETQDWLQDGYYGNQVLLNPDANSTDCDVLAAGSQDCQGDTGISNSSGNRAAIDYLVNPSNPGGCNMVSSSANTCNPLSVPIILYNTGSGTGSNANFNMVAITNVRIWSYSLENANRFLDLEFMNQQIDGLCCSSTPTTGSGLPPVKGTRICGTDHDYQDPGLVAARCTFI